MWNKRPCQLIFTIVIIKGTSNLNLEIKVKMCQPNEEDLLHSNGDFTSWHILTLISRFKIEVPLIIAYSKY